MKSFFMLLFTMSTFITGIATGDIQESETVEATFTGIVDGEYHFTTTDSKISFQEVDATALTSAQLTEKSAVGKKFKVTYTIGEEETEGGDTIEVKTITKLEPSSY